MRFDRASLQAFFIGIGLIALTVTTQAQTTGRILATKKDRVLIEVSGQNTLLKRGDSVVLVPEGHTGAPPVPGMVTPRRFGLEVSGQWSSLSEESGSSEQSSTRFGFDGLFGWNFTSFEVGPVLNISSFKSGKSSATTAFGVGGFADYNFIPNEVSKTHVFSLRSTFKLLSGTSSGFDRSGFVVTAGPLYKAFVLGSSMSVNTGLYYLYQSYGTEAVTSVSQGVVLTTGLVAYF